GVRMARVPVHRRDIDHRRRRTTSAARPSGAGMRPTAVGRAGRYTRRPVTLPRPDAPESAIASGDAGYAGVDGRAVRGTGPARGPAPGGPRAPRVPPPAGPPGGPPANELGNRLAAPRYPPSDARAAPWADRGLAADRIVALPAGHPLRQEIEADTNRRSAPP